MMPETRILCEKSSISEDYDPAVHLGLESMSSEWTPGLPPGGLTRPDCINEKKAVRVSPSSKRVSPAHLEHDATMMPPSVDELLRGMSLVAAVSEGAETPKKP